jgi:hypothetical protein
VFREPDHDPLSKHPVHGAHRRLPRVRVDDAEDLVDGSTDGLFGLPAGEFLRDRVEERDASRRVGGNHGVRGAAQRDREPFFAGGQLFLALPLGHVSVTFASPRKRREVRRGSVLRPVPRTGDPAIEIGSPPYDRAMRRPWLLGYAHALLALGQR